MDDGRQFRVRYWGVTGTLARTMTPTDIGDRLAAAIGQLLDDGSLAEIVRERSDPVAIRRRIEAALPWHLRSTYRGNSTCIQVDTPDELIVLDCGTGFRDLGYELKARWNAPGYAGPRRAHIIMTHPHIDHIGGIPFVELFYNPQNDFTLWAPQNVLDSLAAVFDERSELSRIYVPTAYREMCGIRTFHAVEPGQEFAIGQTQLKAFALNHPGGCVAYRLDRGGRRVVLATDHEHFAAPDLELAEFARGADLLYADAQYLRAEYTGQSGISGSRPISHRGWGHSTVEDVVATALAAEVKLLHLGHHEPPP